MVYLYHYGTTYGPDVRSHVRSLRPSPVLRWWLLGFSDHAAHHRDPHLPWYMLAAQTDALGTNQLDSVASAVWKQWRGPTIIEGSS